MKTNVTFDSDAEIIMVKATGQLDFSESMDAVKNMTAHPQYDQFYSIIFDLRRITSNLSVLDIYNLAASMAWPDPELPTRKKVAVVTSAGQSFDHATFFELCARNRGLSVKSFQDLEAAKAWLDN